MMSKRRITSAPAVAIALCGTLLILGTAVLLAGASFGFDPIWDVEPLTLPEAVALHDNGEVVRLIEQGANPQKSDTVRANFARNQPAVLTPLEAAVATRRADMVQVLLDNGASIDEPTWTRLFCFSNVVDAGEVRTLLDAHRPPGASEACDHAETPW